MAADISPQDVRRGLARHEVPDLLRNDVRLLGGLLGTVLREAGGDDLLADVERLRELTIRAHDESGTDALELAEDLVESFSEHRAEQVARAFTCYFHLANLAEEFHRIRMLREREFAIAATSLRGVIREMDRRFPGLGETLEEETTVAIDGALHEVGYFQELRPGAEVFFIPKIEGG